MYSTFDIASMSSGQICPRFPKPFTFPPSYLRFPPFSHSIRCYPPASPAINPHLIPPIRIFPLFDARLFGYSLILRMTHTLRPIDTPKHRIDIGTKLPYLVYRWYIRYCLHLSFYRVGNIPSGTPDATIFYASIFPCFYAAVLKCGKMIT